MNKHDQAREDIYYLNHIEGVCEPRRRLKRYVDECEKIEKERNELSEKWIAQNIEIEELERDVKRYFELFNLSISNGITDTEALEQVKIAIKLSKVGEEK